MRPKLLFIAFILLSLFGCKKNGGTDSPGMLLKKSIYQDSQGYKDTTIYNYDVNNRLIRLDNKTYSPPTGYSSLYVTYTRNSTGILTGSSTGSIPTTIYHDPVTLHYTYSLNSADSTAFIYTGDVITRVERYTWNTTGPWQLWSPIDLTYDAAGNISVLVDAYPMAGGNYVTHTYTYDTKTSPLHLTNESLVLGLNNFYAGYYSLNNVTYETAATNGGPVYSTITSTYTYNINNMPSTRSFTNNNSGVVTTGTGMYYY